mmetsp:Transcript_42535/g.107314  ORF Transcript_42535/g.107314 Transcript_42535/m.107314 type:complete len:353 (-) Transcript_42535:556-1614(-)
MEGSWTSTTIAENMYSKENVSLKVQPFYSPRSWTLWDLLKRNLEKTPLNEGDHMVRQVATLLCSSKWLMSSPLSNLEDTWASVFADTLKNLVQGRGKVSATVLADTLKNLMQRCSDANASLLAETLENLEQPCGEVNATDAASLMVLVRPKLPSEAANKHSSQRSSAEQESGEETATTADSKNQPDIFLLRRHTDNSVEPLLIVEVKYTSPDSPNSTQHEANSALLRKALGQASGYAHNLFMCDPDRDLLERNKTQPKGFAGAEAPLPAAAATSATPPAEVPAASATAAATTTAKQVFPNGLRAQSCLVAVASFGCRGLRARTASWSSWRTCVTHCCSSSWPPAIRKRTPSI